MSKETHTKETHSATSAAESRASEEVRAVHMKSGNLEPESFPISMSLGEFGDLNSSVLDAYVRTSQAIFESAAILNREMVRFAGERFQADLEALQTLPGYTNMQGVMTFQSDYMRRAADAYQAELTKLMQHNSDAVSTIFEPLIESARASSRGSARK